MSYWLGIDVGTTFTAAAICRQEGGRRPLPEVIPLGSRSAAVSSVVYLSEDGQAVVGEAAERRAVTDSDRVVREFKRRIGDEVPMVIGGVPHSACEIAAMVVRWVVDRVAEREGESAQGITITHPASWGAYKIRILADALHAADLLEVTFRTEPEAAAASYSMQERVATGSTIAVYDLGGGTFDAAVVRKTGPGTFSVLGVPEGIERLGGVDFDDAVFGHVVAKVPALSQLDPEAPATLAATARLRRECNEAKEALSADTEVTIPVLLPDIQSQVRLVRAELEDLIRPQVAQTVEALRRALRSADVAPEQLDAVLLVGGSSRIPLVAQLVSAELGRPVAVDADPTAAIALGAALSALANKTADLDTVIADVTPDAAVAAGDVTQPIATRAGFDMPERSQMDLPHRPTLTAMPSGIEGADVESRRARSRRMQQIAAAGFLALVLVGGAVAVPFLTARSGPIPPADAGTPAPVTSTPIPIPGIPGSVPEAGSGTDPSSGSEGSSGAVRMTPSAPAPGASGTGAKPGGTAHTNSPPTTWTTSWSTSWTKPPETNPGGSDPGGGGTDPGSGGTDPGGGGTDPGGGGTTPGDGGSAPRNGQSTPPNGGSIPGAGESTPDAGESTPDAGGSTPEAGGSTPEDGGATPSAGGSNAPSPSSS
ncbi:MAG: Hsp70 family protein [Actinomycetota bacterium]|nr:Hsp70 family protein [Actinomycetota bacterium]